MNFKVIQKEEFDYQKVLEEGIPVLTNGFSVRLPHLAVFGTLRLGGGNWDRILKDTSVYLDTQHVEGIMYLGGLSAAWTGTKPPESKWCVMDIFKIDEDKLEEVHQRLDRLEAGYYQILFPLEVNGEKVLVKFYHVNPGRNYTTTCCDIHEFYKDSYYHDSIENILKQVNLENTPNLNKFLSFYGKDNA